MTSHDHDELVRAYPKVGEPHRPVTAQLGDAVELAGPGGDGARGGESDDNRSTTRDRRRLTGYRYCLRILLGDRETVGRPNGLLGSGDEDYQRIGTCSEVAESC